MSKRLAASVVLALAVLIIFSTRAYADDSEAADQVTALLTAKGYTVTEVANLTDDAGNTRPDVVYVAMEAVSGNLDSQEMANQVIWGLYALRKYYPRATTLYSAPVYQRYVFFFSTTAATFDKYLKNQITPNAFWNEVRSKVRIYDLVKKVFIGEKDFTEQNQTDKDQSDKDFGPNNPNPVPTPVPGTPGKGATLWLEPSTTYLPTDNKTSATLIGTLLDANYSPAANSSLDFAYEPEGGDEQSLGSKLTDANGTARASVKGTRGTQGLLLRASTTALNSQVSVMVGPAVANTEDRKSTLVQALEAQGYTDVEAEYQSAKRPTGETDNYVIVVMRMMSKTLDRGFYSQMSRTFGTARTLFPEANHLINYMVYRKDGHDFLLAWHATTAYWDQFVAGKMSESEFWRYTEYMGARDENFNPISDKNFMDKSFCGRGGCGTKEARVNRSLESTITNESWGDQWRGQEFVLLPGSYADTFKLTDLSGSATAVQVFQSPEFRTPLYEYKKGDNADKLNAWRLGQGQYFFAVVGKSAPASAKMTFVEHITQ